MTEIDLTTLKFGQLQRTHNRSDFECEEPALNEYLKNRAFKEQDINYTRIYGAVIDPDIIAGYYAICSFGYPLDNIPDQLLKRLPKYHSAPCVLLGRLARDIRFKGNGIGEKLMAHAMLTAATHAQGVGSFALVVESKNDKATAFYKSHGFIPTKNPSALFMPMPTIFELPHVKAVLNLNQRSKAVQG